jgi:uncharacterized protein (TIGR02594 family)
MLDPDEFAKLQAQYPSLKQVPLAPLVKSSLKWVGTREIRGRVDNPVILGWRDEMIAFYETRDQVRTNILKSYRHDDENWCGLFMGWTVFSAGYQPPKFILWSQAYAKIGEPRVGAPEPGDICVTWRSDPMGKLPDGQLGHAGTVIEFKTLGFIEICGGNQSDMVSVMTKRTDKLVGYRYLTDEWRLPA